MTQFCRCSETDEAANRLRDLNKNRIFCKSCPIRGRNFDLYNRDQSDALTVNWENQHANSGYGTSADGEHLLASPRPFTKGEPMFRQHIKQCGCYALALLTCAALVAGSQPPDKHGDSDHARIQGTWKVIKTYIDGKEVAGVPGENLWIFTTMKLIMVNEKEEFRQENPYSLDEKKNPRRIEVISSHKERCPGLYELRGRELRITLSTHPDVVLTRVAALPGTIHVMLARTNKHNC